MKYESDSEATDDEVINDKLLCKLASADNVHSETL